jgi:hypothetical protein
VNNLVTTVNGVSPKTQTTASAQTATPAMPSAVPREVASATAKKPAEHKSLAPPGERTNVSDSTQTEGKN